MKTLQFTSNINCSGCVAAVRPLLDKEPAIHSWQVVTSEPQKTLTVATGTLTAADIQALISKAGFKAQPK